MPNRTHLRATHPFALGVHIVAVDPLRRLHDARFIEVVARAVDPFPARNHGAGITMPIMETPRRSNVYGEKDTVQLGDWVIVAYFLLRRKSVLCKAAKD